MTLQVSLNHRTSYRYDRLVDLGPQTIRLRPAPHTRTPILSYALSIEPKSHFINWQQDPQGNFLARVVFPERVSEFTVTVDLLADMATINPFDFFLEPDAETAPFVYDPALEEELAPYHRQIEPGPLLEAFLEEVPREPRRTIDALVALNQQVLDRVSYIVRMEHGVWTPEQTLSEGRGSCRDSAWLLVQVLRRLGYAARFVSGYLIQLAADVAPLDGPSGPTTDFTDLHAWAEVYLPGAGWIGFDPTSGLMAGEGHIPLAATPDPSSAAPISGLVGESDSDFEFAMTVTRIRETPRVTKPYTEQQWQDILAAGARVDLALTAADVRLTMGGEPTFVAATGMDAPEWNTDALGPTKRGIAGRLLRRLATRWSPGAALQYSQGKQYPGEQIPRWVVSAHWRTDAEPVWNDPALLASDDDDDSATAEDAARFAAALATRLRVDPALILPAYEDTHYYLWREQRLPVNVSVEDAKLTDPLERDRLARVFSQGLGSAAASVLPLKGGFLNGARRWRSGRWEFRGGAMFLIPGDSPAGLRLPLDSLVWADPDSIETAADVDPFAPRIAFPSRRTLMRLWTTASPPGVQGFGPMDQTVGPLGRDARHMARTALVVEPRNGLLHVFFPPLTAAEDWLDLTTAIEATAAELGRRVVLEGYLPPRDPRLKHFSITPDPGVIEVNIHPAANWAEHVERTEALYEAARLEGLATEKFMLDGRHVGTGGGNHVVMGAAEPKDSPFLRRPDLLKSMLGFWHNHPSLSYLFSGLFIGPTSQHPRIDEARQDSLQELEIAFAHVQPGQETAPWLTDRLFRNILADMTGNTHRTEFCIDKLYAPETSTGRLGLVEYRAMEMPPHARMSVAQSLLMRAAIAAFWRTPYERQMIRWGTRLHDQFMLHHYVKQDFRDVLDELAAAGCPLDLAWFEPHAEFRFPRLGEVEVRGVGLELRHALEPWHVLGEEPAGGATARYVDSSTERVQVRVSGWAEERFLLACNGRAVPLSQTGQAGEFVGGVRFKAWAPPSALHPAIRVQSPLVFDVHDRWTGRSLGGLTHHTTHPGGRHYETFPVNANEAEARRRIRFQPFGHTPGPMPEPTALISPETPRTLDLRRLPGN